MCISFDSLLENCVCIYCAVQMANVKKKQQKQQLTDEQTNGLESNDKKKKAQ